MKYSRVYMEAMGYEMAPVVVTSDELENRLAPMYEKLHIAPGQLEGLTGIRERRWWREGQTLSKGAASAARKAMDNAGVHAKDIQAVIYTGVCRENFEPATACAVAADLGIGQDVYVYDISNACLGVLNGIIDIANRIELGQIKAGLVVSCEASREINEITIENMLKDPTMEMFSRSLATLTGGSGAVAVLLTDGSFTKSHRRRLMGAMNQSAPEHHELCRWGIKLSPISIGKALFSPEKLKLALNEIMEPETIPAVIKYLMTHDHVPSALSKMLPTEKFPRAVTQFMSTDSVAVLKHGAEIGLTTWGGFLSRLGWNQDKIDKVICHQVGSGHREAILSKLGIAPEKDFSTFKYLGNIGTVSLPLTAAIAEQRHFLKAGDRVGFLGIGSGLNCLMLGWEW